MPGKSCLIDVTIPSEAVAVNKVRVVRLRMRDFENYASGVNTDASISVGASSVRTNYSLSNNTWANVLSLTVPAHTAAHFWLVQVWCDEVTVEATPTLMDYSFRVNIGGTFYPGSGGILAGTLRTRTTGNDAPTVISPTIVIPKDLASATSVGIELMESGRATTGGNVIASIHGASTHTHSADISTTPYTSPSVQIWIDGVDKTSVVKPAGPFTADTSDIDLTKAISWTPGVHTVEFKEATSGKLGRIQAVILVQTFVKSS